MELTSLEPSSSSQNNWILTCRTVCVIHRVDPSKLPLKCTLGELAEAERLGLADGKHWKNQDTTKK